MILLAGLLGTCPHDLFHAAGSALHCFWFQLHRCTVQSAQSEMFWCSGHSNVWRELPSVLLNSSWTQFDLTHFRNVLTNKFIACVNPCAVGCMQWWKNWHSWVRMVPYTILPTLKDTILHRFCPKIQWDWKKVFELDYAMESHSFEESWIENHAFEDIHDDNL